MRVQIHTKHALIVKLESITQLWDLLCALIVEWVNILQLLELLIVMHVFPVRKESIVPGRVLVLVLFVHRATTLRTLDKPNVCLVAVVSTVLVKGLALLVIV
jgi:hypothetical protein